MSYQDRHFEQQIKLPATWAIIGATGVGLVLAFLMLLGDKRAELTPKAYGNRSALDAGTSLPGHILSVPAHVVGDSGNYLGDYFFAVDENRRLKRQVAQLAQYKDLYDQARALNSRYEQLLRLRTEPPVQMVTARSVIVSRGPFNNNRLIDSGTEKGIRFGNPVITEHGLVGRIVGVSPNVSRMLMITDVISRVPVMISRTDARAMVVGDGGDYPRLEFVRGQNPVRNGDQVLTSGDGGIFPRGLPVGQAVQGIDGGWRVRLYANRAPIDLVKVLLFEDFSQLPNADEVLASPDVTHVLPVPPQPKPVISSPVSAVASASIQAQAQASPMARTPSVHKSALSRDLATVRPSRQVVSPTADTPASSQAAPASGVRTQSGSSSSQ